MDGVKIYMLPPEQFDRLPCGTENESTRRKNLETGIELCIIADYDGIIIGEVNIMFKNDNVAAAVVPNKRAYLYGFHVREELRGFGVGKALLTEAIITCNMRGYIEQTIAAQRTGRAVKLYEKFGFRLFLKDLSFNGETFDLLLRVGDLY